MVTPLEDKIELQKYLYILFLYVEGKLNAIEFEKIFLKYRRQDDYWLSGKFRRDIGDSLDRFFLDLDEFTPDDLYDPNDAFSINEVVLKQRAKELLNELSAFSGVKILIHN
ncbi:MAG: colicin immunity domain-containing protein [Bacteroidota bacterium]